MKALCWYGKHDVRVENVPDPKILNPRDAIVKITTTAICGSDLHLYDGVIPSMEKGDILGHEFMGEVIEVGPGVSNLKVGDRVVVPFTIACGGCFFCNKQLWSLCDNSNPNYMMAKELYGQSPAALFGYSHLYGGYAGGQAEYVRVPFADVGPYKVPEGLTDEQVLFLTDIFSTGYMAADNCNIEPGDTVAVWGAGPVGQFAIKSAYLLGAGRVIAIDYIPERLRMAETQGKADTINFETTPVLPRLEEMTGGRGPDSCIDAVGLEAHGTVPGEVYDWVKRRTAPGDGPAQRAAPGHPGLPQGRHGLHPRRLRRLSGQDPVRRGVRQGPDLQDGPDARSEVPAAAHGPHPEGRH